MTEIEMNWQSYPIYYESSLKFTKTTVTIYDENEVFSGTPIKYEYKDNAIWLMGAELWKIVYLNDDTLKLKIDGETNIYHKW